MAIYDFTVRAEDNQGAFADRNFSIEVQNNLVDRIAVTNGTHVYSSVDGINWTQRTGKGGLSIRNFNGLWCVLDGYRVIRTSTDCINWNEIGTADTTITGVNVGGDNTATVNGAIIYYATGSLFNPLIKDGYVYFYGYIAYAGKSFTGVLKTNNFKDFIVTAPTYEDLTLAVSGTGISQGTGYLEYSTSSNIIQKDGTYYMMNNRTIVYNSGDIEVDPWVVRTNNPNMPSFSGGYPQLINLNGFVVMVFHNKNRFETNVNDYDNFQYAWTYDMNNYNNSGLAQHIYGYCRGIGVEYINGAIVAPNGAAPNLFFTDDLDNTQTIPLSIDPGDIVAHSPYKGKLVVCNPNNQLYTVNQFTGECVHLVDLPYSGAADRIRSIAVLY